MTQSPIITATPYFHKRLWYAEARIAFNLPGASGYTFWRVISRLGFSSDHAIRRLKAEICRVLARGEARKRRQAKRTAESVKTTFCAKEDCK
jgi:hypothetical protein